MPDSNAGPQITGSTQYNDATLTSSYSKLCPPGGRTPPQFALGHIEAYQLQLALTSTATSTPIANKHILDLACGNGYFSNKFLRWGATSVTAMDISAEMVELGKLDAQKQGIGEDKLRFLVGDAMDPTFQVDGAPYEMVTACWLLNYAANKEVMSRIWRFIGGNLRPGGVFVGLTIPPILTEEKWEEDLLRHVYSSEGMWGRRGNLGEVLERLDGGSGFKVRTELVCEGIEGSASFENYHLRLDVFQESCEETEMFEGLEWREFVVPEEVKKGKKVGEWNDLLSMPHCRVCVARRKERRDGK